ncbi:hypothetical protein QTO31_01415 [Chloroflexus sp. MS-CIW-1]|uniref:hypothetical protein n=1 Tax=Chloroflexus sp. MS-CIW-1 TaxID=3055768 RepID=UPI0004DF0EAD|nr:hypothetical protein [Chloroflexus sp. MS-CIW-1]MDN5270622.1 hypothetical protein [Chloroflexus sp. MS-CIW-1]
MPTIPRRWPTELETERVELIRIAEEAAQHILQARSTLDEVRNELSRNPHLCRILIVTAERAVCDALTCTERMRRYLVIVRGTEIHGRWPMVAARQRDDSEHALAEAIQNLEAAQDLFPTLRQNHQSNFLLAEAVLADMTLALARARRSIEQMVRFLTEAAIGRD